MPHAHPVDINRIERHQVDPSTYKQLDSDPTNAVRNMSYPLLIFITAPTKSMQNQKSSDPTEVFMYPPPPPSLHWSQHVPFFYGLPKIYCLPPPTKPSYTTLFYDLPEIHIPYLCLSHPPPTILSICDSPHQPAHKLCQTLHVTHIMQPRVETLPLYIFSNYFVYFLQLLESLPPPDNSLLNPQLAFNVCTPYPRTVSYIPYSLAWRQTKLIPVLLHLK